MEIGKELYNQVLSLAFFFASLVTFKQERSHIFDDVMFES